MCRGSKGLGCRWSQWDCGGPGRGRDRGEDRRCKRPDAPVAVSGSAVAGWHGRDSSGASLPSLDGLVSARFVDQKVMGGSSVPGVVVASPLDGVDGGRAAQLLSDDALDEVVCT